MQFVTHYRPAHSLAVVNLAPNETVRAEASAMISMTRNIQVATTGPLNRGTGGFFGGLKRALLGGETFFTNTFTAAGGPGHVTLAPALTGDMVVHELAPGHDLFIQGGSYVAAPDTVQLDTKWQGMKGFFSGESLFFLHATGLGPVLMNAFGSIQVMDLDGDLVVDTGHVVAFTSGIQYRVAKASSGWIKTFLSGRGSSSHMSGRGRLYLQSRNPAEYGRFRGSRPAPAGGVSMRFDIIDAPNFALLRIGFDAPGEKVTAESGAMVAMGAEVDVQTNMRGGLLAAAKRKVLGGESIFQNTFTAKAPGQDLFLAPPAEGDLKSRVLAPGETFFLQSGAYVAHIGDNLVLDTKWGGVKGFFSGVGLFLIKLTGPGTVFYASYGALHEVVVGPEGYTADTGHIVAFTQGLEYSVRSFGGMKGLFFSGEGLVADFRGQGALYLQTRNPSSLASFLHPFRPVKPRNR